MCPSPVGLMEEVQSALGRGGRALRGSLKRGRKWGPAERLATPWLLPHRTTWGTRSSSGPAMAPWRKTDKERHGVGRSGHEGKAGGLRTVCWKMLRQPAVWAQAGRADPASRAQWLPQLALGPAEWRRGGRGRGTWAPCPVDFAHGTQTVVSPQCFCNPYMGSSSGWLCVPQSQCFRG